MKKALTLLTALSFVCLRVFAQQPSANNFTMSTQQYSATQYITIPANAFSGSAASGTTLAFFNLFEFPTNTVRLEVTPEGGTPTIYTAPGTTATSTTSVFPVGGVWVNQVTPQGQPRATIKVLPQNPGNTTVTIQLKYKLVATVNPPGGGSHQSQEACIFIPVQNTPLHVTLVDFGGKAKDAITQLTWTTQSEDALRGFDVEWSTNLDQWSVVGYVAGQGSGSTYAWQHEAPAAGTNFYRIRSVSQSGSTSYSTVVRVDHIGRSQVVSAVPNPTRDFLRITAPDGATASLIDLSGKEVGRLTVSSGGTMNVGNLAAGMYQLTVRSATGGVLAQERIVKQ